MSNYLAVATVTKALAQILDTAVKSAVDSANAVTQRPAANNRAACVDLFLYQVTPNPALRNSDLPSRESKGAVIKRPTCALDLHYLMSFYGDDSKLEPQRMLGAVVRALLAEPGLTRERILSVSQDDNGDKMSGSNLADAVEQIKFSPVSLTVDELSRIWSIFYQVPYALSLAYTATVVLIESDEPVAASLPVLRRGPNDQGIETQVGLPPRLESWHVGEDNDDAARLRYPSYPSARLDTVLTLRGQNFAGESIAVKFFNQRLQESTPDFLVPLPTVRPNEIKLAIPNTQAAADQWSAGFYSVSVAVTNAGKTRNTNSLSLPLAPQIKTITAGARDADGNVLITVDAAPAVKPTQSAFLSLPEGDVLALPRAAIADPLHFLIPNPTAGRAPVRLRIDGVDSMQFKAQGAPPKPVLDVQTVDIPA